MAKLGKFSNDFRQMMNEYIDYVKQEGSKAKWWHLKQLRELLESDTLKALD